MIRVFGANDPHKCVYCNQPIAVCLCSFPIVRKEGGVEKNGK